MNTLAALTVDKPEVKRIALHLQSLMKSRGLTECELARSLNIPVMTVRRLVSGETVDPRISTLKLFSDYFDVSLDLLIEEPTIDYSILNKKESQPKFVPVLEWHQVEVEETFKKLDKLRLENWHPISIDNGIELSDNSFALQTRLTMQPRFPSGTLLIIDRDEKPQDGDLVLVRMKRDEISLREFVIDSPNKILYPVIQGSLSVKFNERNHQIVGVVVLTLMYPRRK